MKNPIYTRLDDDTLKMIDKLVDEKKFDSRASFIRLAVIEKLESLDLKLLA